MKYLKIILFTLLMTVTFSSNSQILFPKDSLINSWFKYDYFKDSSIKVKSHYFSVKNANLIDTFKTDTTYFDNGKIDNVTSYITNFKRLKIHGSHISFYPNGQLFLIAEIRNDTIISQTAYDKYGQITDDIKLRTMPRLKQGEEYLQTFILENLVYPNKEKEKGLTAKVNIIFYVETDGTMSNINVEEDINENFKKAAIDVLKILAEKSSWYPGYQLGKKVRVKCVLPIIFELE